MALFVVATPIGNPQDISLRAREALASADLIIGEEAKETRRLLKALELPLKPLELLNEHSTQDEVKNLVKLCREQRVALVSDCGTPGFCDPGAELVAACRRAGINVTPVPGASSLSTFMSVSGRRLDQFLFLGFLPANNELRIKAIHGLTREYRPVILMDTPYRLTKLLSELAQVLPTRKCVLGLDLTLPEELVVEGLAKDLLSQVEGRKAEFILLLEGVQNVPRKS